ncbi:MAG TPA: hypothetical protein VMW19_00555 [Myxococcota bacterium]|nr:hypothetical protein [Myxococcota bacterium]
MRASILQVVMLLLAAPVLAHADPGPIGNARADRPTSMPITTSIAASSTTTMHARSAAKRSWIAKTDDANVDCSKIKDDDARRRCVRAQIKN